MLKVPQLDDVTYEQIIQKAVNRIPSMTDQWTDFNYHDPGITILQTYAWLADMLNYYMNATGDVHIQKYMKLLGIEPIKEQIAKAYISVHTLENEISLMKGTRILAGDCVFELPKAYYSKPNRFVSFINEIDDKAIDLTMFAGIDGDYANLFSDEFKEQCIGYFGFMNSMTGENTYYVSVEENGKRNEFDEKFSFGKLTWQYYTADGWKNIEHITDGTCGFLRSGLIKLTINDEMIPYRHEVSTQSAYYVRCILKENYYDILPRIGGIYVDPFTVLQQDTICRVEDIIYDGKTIDVPCYVSEEDYILVSQQTDEGDYQIIYEGQPDNGDGCEVLTGEKPYMRKISFDQIIEKPKTGARLQFLAIRLDFMNNVRLGSTNGCNNQELSFEYSGIHHLGVALWEKREDGNFYYEPWNYVENIETASYQDRVFTYDKEKQVIIFGDGIHGVLPKQGLLVCISELKVSRFGNGNIVKDKINTFEENDYAVYQISNPEDAKGGRFQESMKEMMERLKHLLTTQNRMVAPQDYEEIVMHTPGLILELVKVIPGKLYGEIHDQNRDTNEVVVVVKPCSKQSRPVLSEIYKQRILRYIEPYRLINTKVSIESPSYVGFEVHGKIKLSHDAASEEETVRDWLYNRLQCDFRQEHFGHSIVVGKLFSGLEALECVSQVQFLSVERTGQGAYKNDRGDIILYADALGYVKNIDIEFC